MPDARPTPDDLALVQAMAGGDASALAIFYDRHSPIVYATILRIVGVPPAAEELLVDIFHEFWTRADQYDIARGTPLTYLLMLSRSRAIDRRRSIGKRSNLKLADEQQIAAAADRDPGALQNAIFAENALKIREALAALDETQRRAIECAYFDGLSHTQIAERWNKPLGTVKTYIRQGLIRLRDILRNEEGRPGGPTGSEKP